MELPLYRQLSDDLKAKIVAGVFKSGDKLPSENQLSLQHQLNRATVRQALDELVKDGFIIKHQGKGSIVIDRKRSLGLLSIKGFSDVVRGKKQPVNSIMLIKPQVKSWPTPFTHPLQEKEKGGKCIYLKRLRCVSNEPVMLEKTYLPEHKIPGFCHLEFENGSLFDTLQLNYNIQITAAEQDIRAISADDHICSYLPLHQGEPILQIFLKFITTTPGFHVYSTLFCDTSKYSIGNILEN
ncbi:MAG: GntR family transcriptional regulator [Cyclobacteriaceae bacterium]